MDNSIFGNADNDSIINQLIQKYSKDNEPISISFRDIFPHLNKSDRYTHQIHTYPAKLLVHIPHFFLNNTYFSREGDTVLDPFCGTGTVLLEANLLGRNAIGADANPLARKIAKAKTKKLNNNLLNKYLVSLLDKAALFERSPLPNVVNIDLWFSKKAQVQLANIRRAINELQDKDYRNFFEICFSNCIKKVSYADPRISVPVKINPERFEVNSEHNRRIKKRLIELENIDVYDKFKSICSDNISRINSLPENTNASTKIVSSNARVLTSSINDSELLPNGSVDLIITSPPYAGAQKYIRSSCLNLGWLGLTENENLRNIDSKNIGRENYLASEIKEIKTGIESADNLIETLFTINKQRAYIVANYLSEMKCAINESIRVLKDGGYFIIVIGNNKVCNHEFNTQEYLTEYIQGKGLKLMFKLIDDIKSYGLMTKRNKTADIISREWILVFQKK